MDAKNWIAVGAAGALSLGVVAAGAVTTANAIPLIAGATNIDVPGITLPGDDVKGTTPLDFTFPAASAPTSATSTGPVTLTEFVVATSREMRSAAQPFIEPYPVA